MTNIIKQNRCKKLSLLINNEHTLNRIYVHFYCAINLIHLFGANMIIYFKRLKKGRNVDIEVEMLKQISVKFPRFKDAVTTLFLSNLRVYMCQVSITDVKRDIRNVHLVSRCSLCAFSTIIRQGNVSN